MARLFSDEASDYLGNAAAVLTDYPLTMAGWIYPDEATAGIMISINHATLTDRFQVYMSASRKAVATVVDSGGVREAISTATFTLNTWGHLGGVFESSTSRLTYLNGAQDGSNGTLCSPTGMSETLIGTRRSGGALAAYFSGLIAEVGIWNVALTADEMASLAKSFCPLFIRPGNLVSYHKLFGNDSPEKDEKGAYPMTVTGATKADHPRIIYPGQPWGAWVPAAAGGNPWYYYAQQGAAIA